MFQGHTCLNGGKIFLKRSVLFSLLFQKDLVSRTYPQARETASQLSVFTHKKQKVKIN